VDEVATKGVVVGPLQSLGQALLVYVLTKPNQGSFFDSEFRCGTVAGVHGGGR